MEKAPKSSLVKFQIGPVQDFIAAARSTRDLWSGSYLLSHLVSSGIRAIPDYESVLIFPKPEGQPLLDDSKSWDQEKRLIPNLPNLFIAMVPTDKATEIASAVKAAIEREWMAITKSVLNIVPQKLGIEVDENDFKKQAERHLSISWQVTEISEKGYSDAYRDNGWHLDAIRQTREFDAWGGGSWIIGNEKDSLTGKEGAICGGSGFAERMAARGGKIPSLFKHDDHIGAITLIKRTWHIAHPKIDSEKFLIRSLPDIAARSNGLDDDPLADIPEGENYIAAIAFDGDSIGKWVDGLDLHKDRDLLEHHQEFSGALSNFALEEVRKIVEEKIDGTDKNGSTVVVPLGQLIYAGGDDVVAIVPADVALECALALQVAFRKSTSAIEDKDGNSPDASAGIAIAHVKAPLQDLIRAAQSAEKRAKNTVGRPAFSVALMKRSGEISHWGAKWDSGGIELSEEISMLMGKGDLSAKFPHRICELLEPYITSQNGFSKQSDAPDFDGGQVIRKEFAFAASRQSASKDLEGLIDKSNNYLNKIIKVYNSTNQELRKEGKPAQECSLNQTLLTAIIGLCTTTAFAYRNRPKERQQSASKQPNRATSTFS